MAKAVQTSGGNPDLVVRLGQMYLEQQQLDRAIEQADAALNQQRKHAGAWACAAMPCGNSDAYKKHSIATNRSLLFRSDAPAVQVAMAEIYRQLGRPQRALATLDHLAEHHTPEELPPRAWMLRGMALADLGEDAESKRCFQLARQYAGEANTGLLLELASIQYNAGDLAEARICLGRVLKSEPENPAALDLQSQLDQSFVRMAADQSAKVPAMHVPYQRLLK